MSRRFVGSSRISNAGASWVMSARLSSPARRPTIRRVGFADPRPVGSGLGAGRQIGVAGVRRGRRLLAQLAIDRIEQRRVHVKPLHRGFEARQRAERDEVRAELLGEHRRDLDGCAARCKMA
jgi:hypothetical protein